MVNLNFFNVERPFTCLFAIYIPSLVKYLFRLSIFVLGGLFLFYKYFLSLWLSFPFLTVSFEEHMFLILMKFHLSICSFMDFAFGVLPKKPLPNSESQRFSLKSFFLSESYLFLK